MPSEYKLLSLGMAPKQITEFGICLTLREFVGYAMPARNAALAAILLVALLFKFNSGSTSVWQLCRSKLYILGLLLFHPEDCGQF